MSAVPRAPLARALVAASLFACSRGSSGAPPRADAAFPPPSASTAPAPSASVSASARDASPLLDRAADLAARIAAARADFGPKIRTRVIGDAFLLVEASPAALFDRASELLARAIPPLLDGRFGKPPRAPVTILFFASHPAFESYRAAHYPNLSAGDVGLYQQRRREIVVDGSGGADFLPTLTHEVVHPIMNDEFPDAPTWFREAVASLFEAPVLSKDGGIHGVRRNWRHEYLAAALASPRDRSDVRVDALFAMDTAHFLAWSRETDTIDGAKAQLHAAMARELAAWLDEQGKLWPFYRAWRDGFAEDRTGEKAFKAVMGMTPAEANAKWVAWAK